MDWNTYKRLCDTPNVVSRWLLLETRSLVAGSLRDDIDVALAQAALPKPPGHRGGAITDMIVLDWPGHRVTAVRLAVQSASAEGTTSPGTRQRGLGGFVEAWAELEDHVRRRDRAHAGDGACSKRS